MIKMVATLRRKEGTSADEFVRGWCEEFPSYVRRIAGVRRYVQNVAWQLDRRDWPYDGVAELWFDDVAAVKAAFETEDGKAAAEQELRFVEPPNWFLAEEREVEL